MLEYPARIDAHVIGHHVAAKPNAAQPGAIAQVEVCLFPAKIASDRVIIERVCGSRRLGISGELLDTLRGPAALPQADQPEGIEAAARHHVQFFVRNLVEAYGSAR